jgi:hypothetical protein
MKKGKLLLLFLLILLILSLAMSGISRFSNEQPHKETHERKQHYETLC